ncbi:MAG TPA: hypothetical protein VF119_04130, partial [Candidatus Limnocylindrales bacterium]
AVGRWRGPTRTALAGATLVVAVGFVASQAWPPAGDAYRLTLGIAQWPAAAIIALSNGATIPPIVPVVAVADAEDLVALPVLAVTWWVGSRRVARSKAPAPAPADPASGGGR